MATGLSTFAPVTKSGDLALVRAEGETVGILQQVLHRFPTPAGIITAGPERVREKDIPLLRVSNGNEAARILPFFPPSHDVPRVDDRRVVSGIVYVIKHGLLWKDAPKDCGPHKTLHNRFMRWRRGHH